MRFWLDNGTMRMEGQLIRSDVAELSGRTYPIGVVREMLRTAMASQPLYVVMDPLPTLGGVGVRLNDAVGIIEDVTIGNDGVVKATGRVLDTEKGLALKDMVIGSVKKGGQPFHEAVIVSIAFSTVSLGDVDENGIVKYARLVRVDLVAK